MWCKANGGLAHILKRVVICILSQPCSAYACEHNWSAIDATQTKKKKYIISRYVRGPCLYKGEFINVKKFY